MINGISRWYKIINGTRCISRNIWLLSRSKNNSKPNVRGLSNDYSIKSRTTVGALPFLRLFFVVVYRISRPFANEIVRRTQENKVFRDYVFIPLGKSLHWMDVKVRLRLLNLGGLTIMPKIDDKKAIELGSQLLLEFLVVLIFSAIVTYEYNKSLHKEEEKERKRKQDFNIIKDSIENLDMVVKKQSLQTEKLALFLNDIRIIVT